MRQADGSGPDVEGKLCDDGQDLWQHLGVVCRHEELVYSLLDARVRIQARPKLTADRSKLLDDLVLRVLVLQVLF